MIFRLEAGFLDKKQDFLHWKQDFQIGNTIFRLETGFLNWKQGF